MNFITQWQQLIYDPAFQFQKSSTTTQNKPSRATS